MKRDASASILTLPKGVAALRALLLATLTERDEAIAERDAVVCERDKLAADHDALLARTERLQHLLLKLKRMQFGAKSERLPDEQLQFGFEDLEAAIAEGRGSGGEARSRVAAGQDCQTPCEPWRSTGSPAAH